MSAPHRLHFSRIGGLFAVCTLCALSASGQADNGVDLLNRGELAAAESCFRERITESLQTGDSLDEAIARKWLGISLYRSGAAKFTEATNELSKAIGILDPLSRDGNMDARRELGFSWFSLAEALRVSAEAELRNRRLSGAEHSAAIGVISRFLAPAEAAIKNADKVYPSELQADILYAEAELSLLMARLQKAFMPSLGIAPQSYDRAGRLYRASAKKERERGTDARHDVIISATIRLAEISMESDPDSSIVLEQLIASLTEAIELSTGNEELASYVYYCRARCRFRQNAAEVAPDIVKKIEADLLRSADLIEKMRSYSTHAFGFAAAKSFFTPRTHVYEALGHLYGASDQPESMLIAIERMKARAFRDVAGGRGDNGTFILDSLREALGQQNAGLVEFFYGPSRAWAILVTPQSGVRVSELPVGGQELVKLVQQVRREFAQGRDRRAWLRMLRGRMRESEKDCMHTGFQAAHQLYNTLLREPDRTIREEGLSRIYIVPHHEMHYLPFCALLVDYDEARPLESQFYAEKGLPIVYAPSAALVTGGKGKPSDGESYIFARSAFSTIRPTYPSDLEGTIPEATMAANLANGTLFSENAATEETLRSLPDTLRVLYFATHGVLKKKEPLRSSILLAETPGIGGSTHDGYVTVEELFSDFKSKLNCDLAILSACHTNEGDPSPASGDDIATLSRGFMAAGARSVMATQWEACDGTFPTIMEHYLDAWLRRSEPKDKALVSAARRFLAENDFPIWRHPHFWASSVLIGRPE